MQVKGITATMIFEGSALNRDEKIAGNILSIKKLTRPGGIYSFIGRNATRYHMFTTLTELFNWESAPVTVNQKVVQFDFPEANIVRYPEMDFFGFMNTQKGKGKGKKGKAESTDSAEEVGSNDVSVIRKAPLGITKAVSLEPWHSDMAFYANHDMVNRLQQSEGKGTPDPYQKEEHYSLYKVSFTIDLCRLGYQEFSAPSTPDAIVEYASKLAQVDENTVAQKVTYHRVKGLCNNWYQINDDQAQCLGFMGLNQQKTVTNVVFVVTDEERNRRLYQILTVLKNGIMFHASTEDYGIVPSFLAIANLKVPVPVLHGAVTLKDGSVDLVSLEKGLKNDYVIDAYVDGYPEIFNNQGWSNTGTWEQLLQQLGINS